MSNPEMMRSLMRPAALERAMNVQRAMRQSGDLSNLGGGGNPPFNFGFGAAAGAPFSSSRPTQQPVSAAANPWANIGDDIDAPGNGSATTAPTFDNEMLELQGMGFTDARLNLEALQATGGNVHAAVDRLLSL